MGREGKKLLARVRKWFREATGWERPLTRSQMIERINAEEFEIPESWLKEFGIKPGRMS